MLKRKRKARTIDSPFVGVMLLFMLLFAGGAIAAETLRRDVVHSIVGLPLTLVGDAIKVGAVAPDFRAFDGQMQPVSLQDFKDQVVVISVFPTIDMRVCPYMTRRFNELAVELKGVQMLTVSMDLPFALDKSSATAGIPQIKSVSDYRDAEFGRKYGFLIDELRLLARGTVIIDRQGIVRYVEYAPMVDMEPDLSAAIKKIIELAG